MAVEQAPHRVGDGLVHVVGVDVDRRRIRLEEDRFEDLPSGVFVRGFIKAYASDILKSTFVKREIDYDDSNSSGIKTEERIAFHLGHNRDYLLAEEQTRTAGDIVMSSNGR